jgi:hypothetical protein
VSLALLESLQSAYHETVAADDAFASILCLLSATTYTNRFAEDLEDVFPHVPFPARYGVFQEAVRVGGEIRAIETFARPPGEAYLPPAFIRLQTEPRGNIGAVDFNEGRVTLCEDGSGEISGLPQAVWNFAVSGYRVVPRWLDGRKGLPADLRFFHEFRDICGRVAELVELFDQADIVLAATLEQTLTREALGFGAAAPEANDEPE